MADTATTATRDLTRENLVAELRVLKPVFVDMGVTRMALFGSRARRDNRPDSDIDLIIDVAPDRKFSLLDLIGVGHVVEDHLGIRGDIFMRRSLEPYLVDEARRDAVEVF